METPVLRTRKSEGDPGIVSWKEEGETAKRLILEWEVEGPRKFMWEENSKGRKNVPVRVSSSEKWCVEVLKNGAITEARIEGEFAKAFAFAFAYYGYDYKSGLALLVAKAKTHYHGFCIQSRTWGHHMRIGYTVNNNKAALGLCWRLHAKMEALDTKFCPGVMVSEVDIKPCVEEPVDEEVYKRFRDHMNLKKRGDWRIKSYSGKSTDKWHGVSVEDFENLVKLNNGEKVHHSLLKGVFCYGAKLAGFKKDGDRRMVFPMSPKLNAYVTQEYGEQLPIIPGNVRIIKSPSEWKPFSYSYDVKSCDVKVLPYFRKLLKELYPEDEEKILAPIITDKGTFQLPQFPSGVAVFMKHISAVFTISLLDLAGQPDTEFQVQGDGVACNVRIQNPNLTEFPKGVVNGFLVKEGSFHYVNGVNKLTTPVIYRRDKLNGVKLWEFRRCIYEKYLGALNIDLPHKDKEMSEWLWGLTVQELMEYGNGCEGSRWLTDYIGDKTVGWDGCTTYGARG